MRFDRNVILNSAFIWLGTSVIVRTSKHSRLRHLQNSTETNSIRMIENFRGIFDCRIVVSLLLDWLTEV